MGQNEGHADKANLRRGGTSLVSREWIKLVKDELKERGWTQRKLAEATECHETAASRFLKHREASPDLVSKVASVLGLSDPFRTVEELASSEELREWLTLGQQLLANDHTLYDYVVKFLRARAQSDHAYVEMHTYRKPSDRTHD